MSFSCTFLPKLPMLMPWPGPHCTFLTRTSLSSSPKEMQSSPVLMMESMTLMWLPRVDTVGVRTTTRGGDSEVLESNVVAGDAIDVEVLAILCGDVMDDRVVDEVQAQVDGELQAGCFKVAFRLKGDRGIVRPLHVGLAQHPIPFWDQDLACRC
ncbi:hypothetical protein SASPL_135032 [Salvia splendens]|uniref:Uncharacterized protein n=1 Tax=Salvia splendens TaxID=180675 RepID=A0A8X8WYV5_SALSN|nr:hypothetical protein SASPL_135032 [Salvia splendens]